MQHLRECKPRSLLLFLRKLGLFSIGLIIITLSSCGIPKPPDSVRAKIVLEPRMQNLRLSKNNHTFSYNLASTQQPPPYAPSLATSFDCLIINVMGPDIGNWSANQEDVTKNVGNSYFTVYSSVIDVAVGGSIEFLVPKGKQRIFQALGIIIALAY